jgi:hypothetical protein
VVGALGRIPPESREMEIAIKVRYLVG